MIYGINYGITSLCKHRLFLPPVVITDILSTAEHRRVWSYIEGVPVLPVTDGYRERAAYIRRALLGKKLKTRLADALICQSCLDANTPLITRDENFRHYEKWVGLKLEKY